MYFKVPKVLSLKKRIFNKGKRNVKLPLRNTDYSVLIAEYAHLDKS